MYIGTIDIGGTKTIVAIIDKNGQIVEKVTIVTLLEDCMKHFKKCCDLLKDSCSKLQIRTSQLIGVGVNLPGMVNQEKGILIRAPFAKWENVNVVDFFREELSNPNIFIDNDVNSCALGEKYYGYKDRFKDYIWMTVSTGIGSAVVVTSNIVRGHSGLAGEIGHVKVEYNHSLKCSCGQYGCLEAHASGTAITKFVLDTIQKDTEFKTAFDSYGLTYDAKGCAALARLGNAAAKEVYCEASDYLARGISYGINLLNPEAIILGGGVANSLDIMLPTIFSSLKKYVVDQSKEVEVLYTKNGYEAALLGAAALVLENLNILSPLGTL